MLTLRLFPRFRTSRSRRSRSARTADETRPGRNAADDRYCPGAGISIDGYAGDKAPVAYPDPVYPAWLPALRPWNGAALSSSVKMEDVSIAGFAVGLAVGASTDPRQGDFVQFHRGMISDCKWAVSVGNHQSRNVAIRDSRISNCWTALTNVAHGARAGRFGGVIENVAFGEVINLFDFNAYAGPVRFVACYGEALWRLGWYTGGNGFTPAIGFDHCQFSFDAVNALRGVAARLLGDRLAPRHGGAGDVDFAGTTLVVESVGDLVVWAARIEQDSTAMREITTSPGPGTTPPTLT